MALRVCQDSSHACSFKLVAEKLTSTDACLLMALLVIYPFDSPYDSTQHRDVPVGSQPMVRYSSSSSSCQSSGPPNRFGNMGG